MLRKKPNKCENIEVAFCDAKSYLERKQRKDKLDKDIDLWFAKNK